MMTTAAVAEFAVSDQHRRTSVANDAADLLTMPVCVWPADELASLMALAASGCRISFETLYQQTSRRLLGVILRINSDRGEAEEALQETYVKAWKHLQDFDVNRGRAMAWLTAIARNNAIDSLRQKQSRPQPNFDLRGEDGDPYENLASPNAGPLEDLMAQRQCRVVRACLGSLPREQRESLTLAFYDGLSHQEIAHHLGKPLGTVKSWVRRSLLSLKVSIETSSQTTVGTEF